MNTSSHRLSSMETRSSDMRIAGYDFARAMAILGMVIVNFKIYMDASESGPILLVWLLGLLEGRAAATFVILAGVGISLLSRRARDVKDKVGLEKIRISLLKRALFLFVVGLLLIPIWSADILHFYGIYMTIGAFVLTASGRKLWTLSVGVMMAFVILTLFFDYEKGWNWETMTYDGFWTPSGMIRHLFFNGLHPVIPWIAFILIGMWLGRLDVSNPTIRKKILFLSAGTLALAEGASIFLTWNLSTVFPGEDCDLVMEMLGTGFIPPMPLYLLSAGSTALLVITLSIIVTEAFPTANWISPIVAAGQMSLTLYIAHVVIGMSILEAMGRLQDQSLSFALCSALVFFMGGVIFSVLWKKRFQRGPLELVMRRIAR